MLAIRLVADLDVADFTGDLVVVDRVRNTATIQGSITYFSHDCVCSDCGMRRRSRLKIIWI